METTMLILVLQMLMSGMKGARREMLTHLIEQVRELVEDLKESRARLEVAYNTQDTLYKQVDDLQRRMDEVSVSRVKEEALAKLYKTPSSYTGSNTYQLYVRSGVVKNAAIPVIKALRHVTDLGLREAKEMVDSFINGAPHADSWECLSMSAYQTGLEAALTTLLVQGKLVYNPDSEESDIKVFLNV